MFLSSSSLVIIDPFASLMMGMTSPIIIYILEKYLSSILVKGYSVDAIIMCVLGGIFDSIFTAGRNSRTPTLSDNSYKQGGLQFASLLFTFCMSALFGLLATLILRCFNPRQSVNKDNMLWFIDQ
jgi:ammonia channel protein AmtB